MKRKIKSSFNEAEKNIFCAANDKDSSPEELFGRTLTTSQSNDVLWRPVSLICKGKRYYITYRLTEPIITYKIEQYV